MPASCSSRSTSFSPNRATRSKSNPAKACRKLSRLKDRQPGEARLEPLEHELLEQAAVVVDREAPLGVVVGLVLGRRRAPEAAGDAVLAADDALVAQPRAPFSVSQVIASTDMRPARIAGSSSVRRRVSSRLVR